MKGMEILHTKVTVRQGGDYAVNDGVLVASIDAQGGAVEINAEGADVFVNAEDLKKVMKKVGIL